MNEEAKKGFLTFITTLLIASGVFFVTYFAINALNTQASDTTSAELQNSDQASSGQEKPRVFANLAATKSDGTSKTQEELLADSKPVPSVLAGSDAYEATGGGVPKTGSNSLITMLIMGMAMSITGAYLGMKNSRAWAIRTFEKDITKE